MKRVSYASIFPRRIALLGCALLALSIFAPAVVEAVPITISLDNPNQSVTAPSSGDTILDFAGTITVDPSYHLTSGFVDFALNASQSNALLPSPTDAFNAFFSDPGTGTYTGSIFTLLVLAGTPPDLYAFAPGSNDPSVLFLTAQTSGPGEASASQAFSVLVTSAVPDRGSSILLLGLSLAAIRCVQRTFAMREKRLAV